MWLIRHMNRLEATFMVMVCPSELEVLKVLIQLLIWEFVNPNLIYSWVNLSLCSVSRRGFRGWWETGGVGGSRSPLCASLWTPIKTRTAAFMTFQRVVWFRRSEGRKRWFKVSRFVHSFIHSFLSLFIHVEAKCLAAAGPVFRINESLYTRMPT